MSEFKLHSEFKPTGDQPQAIEKLIQGVEAGMEHQVLLGVTGSGKTFSMANVIEKVQKPTLVISHNKTLAAQLFQEFREFFPQNATHYFVSYYDYYQPEAYVPQRDLYIEKEAEINKKIEVLRHSATEALMTRRDVIVVASVSCIYGLGRPEDYVSQNLKLKIKERRGTSAGKTPPREAGEEKSQAFKKFPKPGFGESPAEESAGLEEAEVEKRDSILEALIRLLYQRNDWDFKRGCFRVRGDTVEVFPPYGDKVLRLEFLGEKLSSIKWVEPESVQVIENVNEATIFPAGHFVTPEKRLKSSMELIKLELGEGLDELKAKGKDLEAHRLKQRTEYDLELMGELGFCPGIENYSRYLSGRGEGEPPYTLLDYFAYAGRVTAASVTKENPRQGKPSRFKNPNLEGLGIGAVGELAGLGNTAGGNWLCIIDESHMTVPQIRGMFNGDRARKETLVEYGFRLPSALDNRPLRFDEFLERVPQIIYTSATPGEWEIKQARLAAKRIVPPRETCPRRNLQGFLGPNLEGWGIGQAEELAGVVEQLIRPTGLLDPEIEIRPTKNQIKGLVLEIIKRKQKGERILVTTLTKRMAEDLAEYLSDSSRIQALIKSPGLNSAVLKGIKTHYLHSEIKTLERSDILADLRRGRYDVVVGINLLREGLDLPEVSLVAILDADKEGFLRSETSLIQTMGRAARHIRGKVILYADNITGSMRRAIEEVERRRKVQERYNRKHQITPKTIRKPVRDRIVAEEEEERVGKKFEWQLLPPEELEEKIGEWEREMCQAAEILDFERAAELRDIMREARKLT